MIRNASVAPGYWLLQLTGIDYFSSVCFRLPVWKMLPLNHWTLALSQTQFKIVFSSCFCVHDLRSFFVQINRNPSPRSSSTSKEGSSTMLTAPSPPCPEPGGTVRETHQTLRYPRQGCRQLFFSFLFLKLLLENGNLPREVRTCKR